MQSVDLSNSETFEREMPHEYFAWLLENDPVHWQPPGPSRGSQVSPMQAEQLLSRLPDIEVSGPVRRLRSSTVNSIKSMPVRFTPESG